MLAVALASATALSRGGRMFMQMSPTPATASLSSVTSSKGPSDAIWNPTIKAAWTKAYQSARLNKPIDYDITEIEGTIPNGLRGTIFRNGPGNFERGGERYRHVLDGDGLLCRFSIDGASGRARFGSRFVETPYFTSEGAADAVLHRNTFGTQPDGGWLSNVGRIALKNPANTHVAASWGGKLLALWEAALPCRIDPRTLAYEGVETFEGAGDFSEGLTVTAGLGRAVDRALPGVGVGFTAHPREDRRHHRMVGWTWAAPIVGQRLAVTITEWDITTGDVVHATDADLPSKVAPHDFALTDSWYVFVLNAMDLKLAPFILGLCGPVGALCTTGEGVTLRLIPRPGGNAADRQPLTIRTKDPYFAIHHATAFEEATVAPGAAPVIRLYTAAWPRVGAGPFLGDWGGDVPLYDDGKINPTQLLQTTVRLLDEGASVERTVAVGSCIDHPHVDPRFDGDAGCRFVYMSYCNDEGNSGSPPVGWARWDRQTDDLKVWRAPPNTFCEEVVVIPRPHTADGTGGGEALPACPPSDEADVWIAAMMFDADAGRSCLAVLDGDNIEAGPVCKLWLRDFVPHGLHGCFVPELYGLL